MQQAQQLQVRVLSCIALVLCFGSPVWAYPEELMCMSSDLCSVGKTKQFKGDIASSGGFKSALESVSYKKEIIVVTIAGQYHLEMLLQLRADFEELGFAHFLILTRMPDQCDMVLSIKEDASCAWDSSAMHQQGFSGSTLLWHLRWRFIARASRLGYNVMSLDSDSHIYQDPYVYLKGYPLQNVTLVGIPEHGCGMNGGFAYVQNARPDGPVSWMFRWVTELPLRWMDDNFQLLSTWGKQKQGQQMCLTFDQSFLDDALHSTIAGTHIWSKVIESCAPDGPDWVAPGEGGCKKGDCQAAHRDLVQCQDKTTKVSMPPPDFWPPPLPAANLYASAHIEMMVPNNNKFPTNLSGPFFSDKGGQYSDPFTKQLKEDCPDCPWWADSDPADKEKAHAIKEIFGFAPNWIWTTSSWMRHGLGTPIDGSRPRQVAVHAHAPAGTSKNSKLAVRKFLARFQWNLSNDLHHTGKLHSRGPYFHGRRPAQRVLLLDPAVDLSRTANHLEMKMIIQGLIELAILSNRTLVYPDVPCLAGWMLSNKDASHCDMSAPLEMSNRELFPYAALDEPWKGYDGQRSYRMVNPFLWEDDCFRAGHFRGMMNVEYEQRWLPVDAPENAKAKPDSSITVFLPGDDKLKPPSKESNPSWTLGESIVTISPQHAATELERLNNEPIVYVGHPVTVAVAGDAYMLPASWNRGVAMDWRDIFRSICRKCRGVYRIPWDYSRRNPGEISDAARGLPGGMKGGVLVLDAGAQFAGGAAKPWKEEELEPKFER